MKNTGIINSKIIIFTLILFIFSKCSFHEVKNEAPEKNEVKKGSKFKISLPEDHTTGYTWQLSQDFNQKLVYNTNAVWHGNKKGIYFNFEALQTGETVLKFVNRKYTDTANVKSFIIKILE